MQAGCSALPRSAERRWTFVRAPQDCRPAEAPLAFDLASGERAALGQLAHRVVGRLQERDRLLERQGLGVGGPQLEAPNGQPAVAAEALLDELRDDLALGHAGAGGGAVDELALGLGKADIQRSVGHADDDSLRYRSTQRQSMPTDRAAARLFRRPALTKRFSDTGLGGSLAEI